ncbi:hypothetical protein [Microbacterium sp. SD291]|uniref:hypothetical protein n=1 Tax=Microbacterium sp. SD291 TaxID=2782007 RepID=UPI001A9653DB|nr:hypothetical protein [Microbacterium sp. SD291]MBO0979171.1 hypothetical protein [Microbacterium sp. SD291]
MTHPSLDRTDRGLRRSAGAGALIYVASFVAATFLTGQPTVHDGQESIEHTLVETELGFAYAGMYVLTLGFLVLLPVMIFLSAALGRRSALSSWAARTAAAVGIAYIVIIVGVGFSAGAAALWGLEHGLDLPSVLSLNNVRNFAYFVATPFMGMYAIAIGVAALGDRVLVRWMGWGGVVVGAAFLLAIPAAAIGVQYAMPIWLLWWIGNGIVLLRRRPVAAEASTERSPIEPSVRHH